MPGMNVAAVVLLASLVGVAVAQPASIALTITEGSTQVVAGESFLLIRMFATARQSSGSRDFTYSATQSLSVQQVFADKSKNDNAFTVQLSFSAGEATISMVSLAPDNSWRLAQDITLIVLASGSIPASNTLVMNLIPGPASRIVMAEIPDGTVGTQIPVSVSVFDANGNVCASGTNRYSATLGLTVTGRATGNAVIVTNGAGTGSVYNTRAETITVTLTNTAALTVQGSPQTVVFNIGNTAAVRVTTPAGRYFQGGNVTATFTAFDAFSNIVVSEARDMAVNLVNGKGDESGAGTLSWNNGVATALIVSPQPQALVIGVRRGDQATTGVDLSSTSTVTFEVICDGVSFFQDLTGQITCKPVGSVCQPGTFLSRSSTPTSDRACTNCASTEFQNLANQTACKPISAQCTIGFRESTSPDRSTDRVCLPCDGNTQFQDVANQKTCKTVRICTAGTEATREPTPSTDRTCGACRVGTADKDSNPLTPCAQCAQGLVAYGSHETLGNITFTQDTFNSSVRVESSLDESVASWKVHAKSIVRGLCSAADVEYVAASKSCNQADCGLPLLGTTSIVGRAVLLYSSLNEILGCFDISLISAQDFQNVASQTACKPVTRCNAGQEELAAPTLTSDRTCRACVTGSSYQSAANQRFCWPVSQCPVGEEQSVAATATTDRTCKAVTCQGLSAPTYGSISQCSGTQTFGTSCTYACKNANFVLDGSASRTCSQDGRFNGTQPTCKCKAGLFLDAVLGDCVEECPTETFANAQGVCTQCAAACVDGKNYESRECSQVANTNRVCTTCSVCPNGKFKVGGCAAGNDTECGDFQACDSGEYQSFAGNATVDRICDKCTVCPNHQFLLTGCCGSLNSQCTNLTVCRSDEFEVKAPTVTSFGGFASDRVCRKKRTCGLNEYVLDEGNTATDRTCIPCGECPEGQYVASRCTATSNTTCAPQTVCDSDEYIVRKGSLYSDTQCAKCRTCSAQQYAAGGCNGTASNTDCRSLTVCDPVTEFEIMAPTVTSDRECETCSTCSASTEVMTQACNATADTVCTTNKSATAACPRGQIAQFLPKLICLKCQDCPSGSFADGGVSCPLGPTAPICKQWSVCKAGEVEVKAPTSTSDRICEVCPLCPAENIDMGGCNATVPRRICVPWVKCLPSQYVALPGSLSAHPNCTACTVCRSGEYAAVPCSASSDTVCLGQTRCATNERAKVVGTAVLNTVCEGCGAHVYGRASTLTSCPLKIVDRCSSTTVAPTTTTARARWTFVKFSLDGDFVDVSTELESFSAAIVAEIARQLGVSTSQIRNVRILSGSILVQFDIFDQADGSGVPHEFVASSLEEIIDTFAVVFKGVTYSVVASSFASEPEGAASSSSSSSATTTGAIVGGVLGGLVVIALIIFAVYYSRRNRVHTESGKHTRGSSVHSDGYIGVEDGKGGIELKSIEEVDGTAAADGSALGKSQLAADNDKVAHELSAMKEKLDHKSRVGGQQLMNRTAEQVMDAAIAAKLREENLQLEREISAMKQMMKKKKVESRTQAAATEHIRLKAEKAALEQELAAMSQVIDVTEVAMEDLRAKEREEEIRRAEEERKRKAEEKARLEKEIHAMQAKLKEFEGI